MIDPLRIVDCEQGSPEWFAARRGVVTSSKLATVAVGGKGAQTYARELAAELLSDAPAGEGYESSAMRHGKQYEPRARQRWGLDNPGCDITVPGFVYHDETCRSGASSDGIVNGVGMLEIKCPQPAKHIEYKLAGELPKEYRWQVAGEMLVPGVEWVDFISYSPQLEAAGAGYFCVRTTREELAKELEQAATAIDNLTDWVDSMISRLVEK
jgi:putative phage-type endonuclease